MFLIVRFIIYFSANSPRIILNVDVYMNLGTADFCAG